MPASRERLRLIWAMLCWIESPGQGRQPLTPPQSHHATAVLCGVSLATVKRAEEMGHAEDWPIPEGTPPPLIDDEADDPVIVPAKH